jgi:hypothetical protein
MVWDTISSPTCHRSQKGWNKTPTFRHRPQPYRVKTRITYMYRHAWRMGRTLCKFLNVVNVVNCRGLDHVPLEISRVVVECVALPAGRPHQQVGLHRLNPESDALQREYIIPLIIRTATTNQIKNSAFRFCLQQACASRSMLSY